jgi:hypothetical protein
MLATAAVDAALLALGPGHSAVGAMADAQGHFHGPTFDGATIGPVSIDYPDLVLAAILGGTAADDQARQRRAAVLLTALAGCYGLLLPVVHMLPATVPIALTYFVLYRGRSAGRACGLLQRAEAALMRRLGAQHGGSAVGDAPLRRRRPVRGGFAGRGA